MTLRDVEVKLGDKWLLTRGLQDIRKGQTFRMWDDIDTPVIGENGQTEFLATSEPFWNNDAGVWQINIDNTDYSENLN